MAYSIIAERYDARGARMCDYLCDTAADLPQPSECIAGSTAYVADEKKKYIVNCCAEWCEQPAEGAGGGADWNASEGEAGYVKNRTHYEAVETVSEPLNITWDGNTEGLVCVEIFYKVSDLVLTDEQIKSAALTDGIGDALTFADNWDGAVASGFVTEDIVAHFPTFLVVFVRKDGAELNGFTFPACGIYIAKQDGGFISSITTTEPVEQTKTVVHKLDKKYLPDVADLDADWLAELKTALGIS